VRTRLRLAGRGGALAGFLVGALVAACAPDRQAAPAAAAGARSAGGPAPASAGPPPLAGADVLLVTIDTLRADALGFAGRRDVLTPTLDRLAAAGRVMTSAHAHNVTTLPSHANILTGLYPYQHGVRENAGFVLADDVPTLATLLRGHGYATAAVVGAFPLDSRFGLARGFDLYDDDYPQGAGGSRHRFAERRGDEVVRLARAWWEATSGKRFLWAHLYDPHAPYAPAPELAARHPAAPYYGEVEAVDRYLEPLLAPFLDGRERPALVIVTADHGEALGDHGELTHGLFAYEATLAVPLLLWHPGIEPQRDPRPAGHVDLLPTVLDALGLPLPPGLPGHSLFAPEAGGRQLYFEALATYFNRGWAPLRGLLADGHKAIELPLPELYDLGGDPAESRNLVDAERRRFRELTASLPATPAWPPGQRTIEGEEAARLRSLGYLSAAPAVRARFGPEDDPKSLIAVDRKIHETIDAHARGELDAALRLARELVEQRPSMPFAYEQEAIVLRDLERPREAIAVMERAVANGAADSSLLRQLGLTLAEVGRAGEAVELLRSLAVDPSDLEAVNGLAVALSDTGRHDEALETLARVFAVDPEDAKALETLGVVELRRRRPAAARQALERALARNPNLPLSWNTLGVAHAYEENFPAAIAAWERAVALDPRLYDALYNLGVTAARLGDTARARAALSRYLAVTPADRDPAETAKVRQLLASLQ
jgi:arylsulfatase A-like enzyme/tetratricopeptide (TPR) repeat protein